MTYAPLPSRGPRLRGGDVAALLAALLFLLVCLPAQAQAFPKLTGRVVDGANIIPDDREAALVAKLEGIEKESTRQLVVATVADLEGYDIAEYGYKLGDAWGIGQKGESNGIILLVAPNERRVRIEVGYGLEPIMTDVFSGRIIRNEITPRFKAGDYPGGIEAGVDQIAAQLRLPPEEAAKIAKAAAAPPEQGVDIGSVIIWLFIFFFFILPLLRSLFGGRKRGRRHGSGPVIIWGGGGDWGGGSSWGSGGGGGGFSGGGGSFGGGGASGGW